MAEQKTKIYVNARAIIERDNNGTPEILLQTRTKPGQAASLELPGGQLEPFEPLLDALRREVKEETGLSLSHIEGEASRLETDHAHSAVECIQPFGVYQTLRGPVDSMGVYFRCQAEGELLAAGDDTKHPTWLAVAEVKAQLEQAIEAFSWVDRAGLRMYLAKTS